MLQKYSDFWPDYRLKSSDLIVQKAQLNLKSCYGPKKLQQVIRKIVVTK
jgi:hypothetical protein